MHSVSTRGAAALIPSRYCSNAPRIYARSSYNDRRVLSHSWSVEPFDSAGQCWPVPLAALWCCAGGRLDDSVRRSWERGASGDDRRATRSAATSEHSPSGHHPHLTPGSPTSTRLGRPLCLGARVRLALVPSTRHSAGTPDSNPPTPPSPPAHPTTHPPHRWANRRRHPRRRRH